MPWRWRWRRVPLWLAVLLGIAGGVGWTALLFALGAIFIV